MSSKEKLYNRLYIGHALIIWAGSINQIIHIFAHQSAQDITVLWIACLLGSELLALPRSLKSHYWVWGMCHAVSTILVATLLTGVILYG